jgi:PKD repeat protein
MQPRMKSVLIAASVIIMIGLVVIAGCIGPNEPKDGGGDLVTTTPPVYDTSHDAPPHAAFSCSPASGRAPLSVRCDASSSSGMYGPLIAYVWRFGDGAENQGTEVVVDHTYSTAGNYTVELWVSDTYHLTSSAEQAITIT